MRLQRFFLYSFILIFSSCFAKTTGSFLFDMQKDELVQKMSESFESQILLDSVSYFPRHVFSDGEFEYLTGFIPGKIITVQDMVTAFCMLQKKNIFQSVTFTFDQKNNGSALHCDFKMDWIIKWVKLRGIGFQQEHYLQSYGLYAGDHFIYQKHMDALSSLKEYFKKEGYFDVQIIDTLQKNNDTHEVTVYLQCKKGPRFSIAESKCSFLKTEIDFSDEIQQHVIMMLHKQLVSHNYSEKRLIEVTKEVKKYLKNNGYIKTIINLQTHVETASKELFLTFTFTPTTKRNFVFLGNAFFKEEELLDFIYRFGDSVSLLSASLFAQDIKTHYYKKGFWGLLIEGHEENNSSFFVIKEGPRITINDVRIKTTAGVVPPKKVKKFFSSLLKMRFFDSHALNLSIDALLGWYHGRGYLGAAVIKRTYHSVEEDKSYLLDLLIDEGKQYLLYSEEIPLYPHLLHKGPFAKTKKGVFYTASFLKERKEWLQNYFKKKGHLWVHISYQIVEGDEGDTVVWNIKKGDPLVFGKTVVRGITPISYKTFLQHLQHKEGFLWNKQALQETQNQFKMLDVFKHSSFYPDPEYSKKAAKDVLVNLQGDDFFELRTRLGFSQVSKNLTLKKGSTYKVGGSLFFRNVTGNADIIRSDIDVTRFERRISALYETPHFLHTPCAFITKLYAHNYTQPLNAGSSKTLYKTQQEGFLATVALNKRTFTAGITCGCEWAKTTDISYDLANAINFTTALVDKKIPSFFIEPNLFIDLLDNKLEPTKGCFMTCLVKAMMPLNPEGAHYIKFLVEQGMFFPLIKNSGLIMGLRVKFGHIFRQSFSCIMPPDRFYLGGANSLRGYLPDRCPPLGKYIDESGEVLYVPQGGKSLLNMNIELRIPVYKQLSIALFQDAGMLAEALQDLSDTTKQLAATGVGLRILTPFGPLRFDIGFKWKKDYPEDSRYAWFLTFGHAF